MYTSPFAQQPEQNTATESRVSERKLKNNRFRKPHTQSNLYFFSGLAPLSNSHDSPISQMPKPFLPCSIPFHSHASLSSFGGAITSSSVNTQVPQCMPSALTQRVSMKMLTASLGFAWTLLKAQRGSYAPMGMRPRSKGPLCLPICAKAGHVGRCEYAAE